MPSSLDYTNGVWTVKKDASTNAKFKLENIKSYFNGDFSEIQEALNYQPNNQIKLLYGVKTTDGKQYQQVCTREQMMLNNAAGSNAITKLANDLANAKNNGSFSNIDYRVQELQEYDVQPTNLEAAPSAKGSEDSAGDMPWD
jgi:PHP family Zn ribbon phosphoesterase